MGRSAGISGRAKGIAAAAALLPFLALTGCANSDRTMAEKLAAAEAAAGRAEAAQHAAEKAAQAATAGHPAPAPEPTVMADTSSENDNIDNGDDHGDSAISMGGPGQTVAQDGTFTPRQGA